MKEEMDEVAEGQKGSSAEKSRLRNVGLPYLQEGSIQDDSTRLMLSSTMPSWEETVHGMTCPLMFSFVACCVGTSFQSGYNLGVLNAPQSVFEAFLSDVQQKRTGEPLSADLMTWLWALTVSIFCVGAIVGGIAGGSLANQLGRRGAMLLNNLFTLIAGLLFCLSKPVMSYELLICGRFIAGISAGISTGVAPLYLSEIAPITLRGAAGCLSQFTIILGILLSMILGLPTILGTAERWPILLGLCMVPAVLQLIMLPFCPESPRFLLITKENYEEAKKALRKLRSCRNVQTDLEDILTESELVKRLPKVSIGGLFKYRDLRKQIIASVMLQFSQQFSGIVAICFYSTSFFQSASLTLEQASYGTIGVFIVNGIMTFVSMMVMDKAGRRTLQLYGLAGMWASSMLITVCLLFKERWSEFSYLIIVFTIVYVMVYALGPGPIPWFMVAEFFPQGSRGAAMSLSVMCNWLAAFIVGLVFPWMQLGLGDYVFLPFSVMLAGFWIFTYLKIPETRQRSIVEISSLFLSDPRKSVEGINREAYEEIDDADSTSYRAC